MNIVIKQPAGIGDIIFCQKIENYLRKDFNTFWPVNNHISYISRYIKNPSLGRELPEKYKVLDLDSTHLLGGSVLTAKYRFMNLGWDDWRDFVIFERDYKKENELYDLLVGEKKSYVLLNNFVGTPPNHKKYNIKIKTDKPIIELSILDGFTVFDWCKILENADEIYTIDTSINYIIEFLQLKATKLECYSRFTPANFSHIQGLWKKNWNYITWENI